MSTLMLKRDKFSNEVSLLFLLFSALSSQSEHWKVSARLHSEFVPNKCIYLTVLGYCVLSIKKQENNNRFERLRVEYY